MSHKQLGGATVDFVDDVMQSGFRVFWPSPKWDDPIAQRVQDVLDQQVNPGVASHGGHVALERKSRATRPMCVWAAAVRGAAQPT